MDRGDACPGKRKMCGTPEKRKKVRGDSNQKWESYNQKYRPEWEDESVFKGWLRPVKDNVSKGHCVACNTDLAAKRSVLERHHATTSKHITRVKIVGNGQRSLLQCFSASKEPSSDVKVKRAEIL